MSLIIIDPLVDHNWSDFIFSHPGSDIFHHPSWLKVLSEAYKYKVFAVVKKDSLGKITAGIPFCEISRFPFSRHWISLPFSDHCIPLNTEEDDLREITKFVVDLSAKMNIRRVVIYSDIADGSFGKRTAGTNHVILIKGDDDCLLGKIDRQKRQGISKAKKGGLTAEVTNSHNSLERFYELHLKTRKKLGIPVQPREFFEKIYEEILLKNLGFIILVKKDDQDAAAGLFLQFKDKILYKYNASDPEFLKFRPNNLLIWTAMQKAVREKFRYIDFGRTSPGNAGLKEFKSGWGSVEKTIYYSDYPPYREQKKIDVFEKRIISPLIRILPVVFCKIIGELVYKFLPLF